MRERLYRSRDDRMLFGVAGGMAEWLDLDPAIVRLVWALLILAAGVGFVLYIVAALVIPEAPVGSAAPGTAAAGAASSSPGMAPPAPRAMRRGNGNAAMVFGLILVILGAWFLLRRFLPALDLSWVMPVALIVVGLALVVGAMGRSRGGS